MIMFKLMDNQDKLLGSLLVPDDWGAPLDRRGAFEVNVWEQQQAGMWLASTETGVGTGMIKRIVLVRGYPGYQVRLAVGTIADLEQMDGVAFIPAGLGALATGLG